MKNHFIFLVSFFALFNLGAFAQKHTPLPHGMIYGSRPSVIANMPASKLEGFMDKRTRTSAVIVGRILSVTKTKGGWFTIDAGGGKVIAAHFKDAGISIPTDMKGREVIVDGIAQKEFIADDLQPMAGDTVRGKKQHKVKTNPDRRLTFEVKGLMVNK